MNQETRRVVSHLAAGERLAETISADRGQVSRQTKGTARLVVEETFMLTPYLPRIPAGGGVGPSSQRQPRSARRADKEEAERR